MYGQSKSRNWFGAVEVLLVIAIVLIVVIVVKGDSLQMAFSDLHRVIAGVLH